MSNHLTLNTNILNPQKVKKYIVWGYYENGSDKLKHNIEILNKLEKINNDSEENNNFNLSDNQIGKILEIENNKSASSYKTLELSYKKIEIPFESLDKKLKKFMKDTPLNDLSLMNKNQYENENFIYGQIYRTHIQNTLEMHIEVLNLLENPKLNILTRL